MPSDFGNLKDSGRACVGCGKTADQALLHRINTYARSFACWGCWQRYIKCANERPDGRVCGDHPSDHQPKGDRLCAIPGCGCPGYRHGLEGEFDRMYADCVGKTARTGECTGFGANTGNCGRIVYQKPDGSVPRLCPECERSWINEVMEGSREAQALNQIDPEKVELPQ